MNELIDKYKDLFDHYPEWFVIAATIVTGIIVLVVIEKIYQFSGWIFGMLVALVIGVAALYYFTG